MDPAGRDQAGRERLGVKVSSTKLTVGRGVRERQGSCRQGGEKKHETKPYLTVSNK